MKPGLKLTLLTSMVAIMAMSAQAHSPFIAPQSYIVEGNNTTVIGGFAEKAFDSEVALRGFSFAVTYPDLETDELKIQAGKSLSIADVESGQKGTYKLVGARDSKLEFVQVGKKWLRVFNSEAKNLPPLAERNFITPAEVTAKMKKVSSTRYERLLSFFSKSQTTDAVLVGKGQGLLVQFSQHPNTLTTTQPLTLTFTIDGKLQTGLSVVALKNLAKVDEKELEIKQTTNGQGQVQLTFPQAGQYLIEVNSPEVKEGVQPSAETHRLNISLQVN